MGTCLTLDGNEAGADALELNVVHVAADSHVSGEVVESRYVAPLREPAGAERLPQFVKQRVAAGVSLFDRFCQPDIDPETLKMVDPWGHDLML